MKKILCIVLALSMLAATAMILSSCGDDKDKASSKTESTKAPTTATETAAPTETTVLSTVSPAPLETLAPDEGETEAPTEEQATEENQDPTDTDYYGTYGGLTGQEAILQALSYAGAGYQCVSYNQMYLHNNEAWYIGLQASDGSDGTVYYLYVNANECVPESEIPNIGGENGDGSGVFDENYAGISEQEAIFRALEMRDDNCTCVSSEKAGAGATEYWRIGIQSNDDPDGEIFYYWVNSETCFPE